MPAARAAGVRTPALVAFDDSLQLLPVPCDLRAGAWRDAWCLTSVPKIPQGCGRGGDLARLHEGVGEYGPVAGLECEPLPDRRPMPDELASAGYFTSEARWLLGGWNLLAPSRSPRYRSVSVMEICRRPT